MMKTAKQLEKSEVSKNMTGFQNYRENTKSNNRRDRNVKQKYQKSRKSA